MLLLKPNGISVLIAAQNEEKTIKLCVESFLKFADEIIIVTNGSTDNTKSICLDLEKDFAYKVKYFDKPDLPDLYNNRAFALSMAKYKWIFRGDADYIAYTDEDGINSISLLRNIILNHKAIFPTVFYLEQINIYYKLNLTSKLLKENKDMKKKQKNIKRDVNVQPPPTIAGHMPRVYLNTPLLQFKKIKRREGAPYMKFYKKIYIDKPYWFHVTLKSDKDLFKRSERANWRSRDDFKSYPTLDDYIEKYVLPIKYKVDKKTAIKEYINTFIKPYLIDYNEIKYYPYPKKIKQLL